MNASPIAALGEVDNLVRVIRGPGQDPLAGEDDMELFEGDTVETLEDSAATITFEDNHIVKISGNTRLVLESMKVGESDGGFFGRVRLLGGSLVASIEKFTSGGSGFEVATDTAVAAVKGTTFEVDADETNCTVSVLEGTVVTASVREDGTSGDEVVVKDEETAEVGRLNRRPSTPRRFKETGRWTGMRKRMRGVRDGADRHRRMRRSGELHKVRRLRRLSRAANIMEFIKTNPEKFAALPPAQQENMRKFVQKNEDEMKRAGPEIEAFNKAHPEWKKKMGRMRDNRSRLHERSRGGKQGTLRERRGAVQKRKEAVRERKGAVQEHKGAVQKRKEAVQERKGAVQERKGAVQEPKGKSKEQKDAVQERRGTNQERKGAVRERKGKRR